jgi:hypothetical protein
MLTNRNAQAALMVTFAAGAVIFLVAWWALRIPNTNIASEIAENGGLQGTGEVAIGASRPLIPEVLLTIIHVRWSDAVLLTRPQSRSYPRRSVGPINPDFRFLVVDYEIDNGSDDWLTRKGLTDLLRVMGSGGPSFQGMDIETISRFSDGTYEVSDDGLRVEIPPTETHPGIWVFEADSRQPNLRLTSDLIGFELPLPVHDRSNFEG